MIDPADALTHVPDADDRYQVLAVTRGGEVYVEVYDDVAKGGVVMDMLSALRVASAISSESARILEHIADHMQDGTLPVYERHIAKWGSHGEGAADQN